MSKYDEVRSVREVKCKRKCTQCSKEFDGYRSQYMCKRCSETKNSTRGFFA